MIARQASDMWLVVRSIAERFKTTVCHLQSPCRERETVRARRVAILALYAEDYSKAAIAEFMRKDRAAIHYALRKAGVS